jgi:hypothetical protein
VALPPPRVGHGSNRFLPSSDRMQAAVIPPASSHLKTRSPARNRAGFCLGQLIRRISDEVNNAHAACLAARPRLAGDYVAASDAVRCERSFLAGTSPLRPRRALSSPPWVSPGWKSGCSPVAFAAPGTMPIAARRVSALACPSQPSLSWSGGTPNRSHRFCASVLSLRGHPLLERGTYGRRRLTRNHRVQLFSPPPAAAPRARFAPKKAVRSGPSLRCGPAGSGLPDAPKTVRYRRGWTPAKATGV